jgi:hypothetical protein
MKYNGESSLTNLKNRVSELKIDFEEFAKIIIEYKILLSGSFLLQVVTNKIFKNYDIDLFLFSDRNLLLEEKICDLLVNYPSIIWCIQNIDSTKDSAYIKSSGAESIHYDFFGIKSVTTISLSNFGTGGLVKIQLIYIDDMLFNTLSDCIKAFDFDICMNYWNGTTIFIGHVEAIEDNKATLYANNTSQILTQRQESRIKKYAYRDYNIQINFVKLNVIYNTLVVTGFEIINKLSFFNLNCKNLMIVCLVDNSEVVQSEKISDCASSRIREDVQQNYSYLPNELENLVIYEFGTHDQLFNLPINLKKIDIYDETNRMMSYTNKIRDNLTEKYSKIKIPFGCDFFVNGKLFL